MITSKRGGDIARTAAAMFAALTEHAKSHPGEVDQVVSSIVATLRSWRPESVSPLGTLPAPTDRIVDPRNA